jgi:hypothetical protein
MAGVIKIQIIESTQELKRQLKLSENSEVKVTTSGFVLVKN